MEFTDGDFDMIRWVNGHGFATIRRISQWMGSSDQAAQRRMQRLIETGMLCHEWLMRRERNHWPTKLGIGLFDDDLPPRGHIAAGTYNHTLRPISRLLRAVAVLFLTGSIVMNEAYRGSAFVVMFQIGTSIYLIESPLPSSSNCQPKGRDG